MQQLLLFSQSPRTEFIQDLIKIVKKFGGSFWFLIIWQLLYFVNFSDHAHVRLNIRVQLLQTPKKIF